MQTSKKIILPSRKVARLIEIKNLDKMTVDFFSKLDLGDFQRYACIAYASEGLKTFVMAIKEELKKKEVLDELKADLEFQMAVLKQL